MDKSESRKGRRIPPGTRGGPGGRDRMLAVKKLIFAPTPSPWSIVYVFTKISRF